MTVNRRDLLAFTSAAALIGSGARAQPMPVVSSTVPQGMGAGPLPVGTPWGASLDLSFMTPSTLDPRIAFTRASIATYFDATGTLQTAPANAPRWDYDPVSHALRGMLIEEARTNVLLNSATLVTQSVTVTAQAYTLSFYGTGTVTLSGASTGSLVGTGAFPQRVARTFTPTAGTLTCTVTGTVQNAQLEAGSFVTSYVPVTAAAVTRNADVAIIPTPPWLNAATGSMRVNCIQEAWIGGSNANNGLFALDDGTGNGANVIDLYLYANAATYVLPSFNFSAAGSATGTLNGANVNIGAPGNVKIACAWTGTTMALSLNGAATQTAAATGIPTTLSRLIIGYGFSGVSLLNGHMQRLTYWPRVLSNAEMQSVTT
jgi:hypothetical protein